MKKETLVGILGTIGLVFSLMGINWIKKGNYLNRTITITAEFDHVKGLFVSQPVRIRGSHLGGVTRVYKKEGSEKILVEMKMEPGVKIPKNAVAVLQGSLVNFAPPEIYLKFDGACSGEDCLQGDETIRGRNMDIEDFMDPETLNQADPILAKLGNVDSVYAMLDEWTATSAEANKQLKSLDRQINSTLKNATSTTKTVKDNSGNIEKLITQINSIAVNVQKQDIGKTLASVDASLVSIDKILASTNIQIDSVNVMLDKANTQVEQIKQNPNFQKLVNDASVPAKLFEQIEKLHCVLIDFKENPRRYLKLGKKNKYNQIRPCE
ncbi:MAG: MlaD family protein [Saprospiraceae bacterium]|nr:MlaD family protein [Saprospiraceae bacterium]